MSGKLVFELYCKEFYSRTETWNESLITTLTMTRDNGKESYIKTVTFNQTFPADGTLLIKCADTGLADSPDGAGSSSSSWSTYVGNIKLSLYYTES